MDNKTSQDRLFAPGPKRILSLDGGGIRGLLTLGILEHVEERLKERVPEARRADFVLADYFDLIAGTSTGAIIAALLAMGRSVADVRASYQRLGPKVFASPNFLGQILWTKFNADQLETFLKTHFGEKSLATDDLRTGLLLISKRVDTGSAWLQANNTRATFWDKDKERRLRQLVRASTAAPSYFKPAPVYVNEIEPGIFIDGAMAGYNNPALAAFLYATADEYGLNWRTGPEHLFLLSIGTGFIRPRITRDEFRRLSSLQQAIHALRSMVHETSMMTQHTLQAISQPLLPFQLNGEVNGLERTMLGGAPLLAYERIDPQIDKDALLKAFEISLSDAEAKTLQKFDVSTRRNLRNLLAIGKAAGARMPPEIFPAAFDPT